MSYKRVKGAPRPEPPLERLPNDLFSEHLAAQLEAIDLHALRQASKGMKEQVGDVVYRTDRVFQIRNYEDARNAILQLNETTPNGRLKLYNVSVVWTVAGVDEQSYIGNPGGLRIARQRHSAAVADLSRTVMSRERLLHAQSIHLLSLIHI